MITAHVDYIYKYIFINDIVRRFVIFIVHGIDDRAYVDLSFNNVD